MKVLVTGVAGQLGFDVINELYQRGIECIGTDIKSENELIYKAHWSQYIQSDITDGNKVTKIVKDLNPDVIIHCAAWTNVDGAEDEKNKEIVYKINVCGTDNLVKASKLVNAKFLYISTDYVFNGKGIEPWKPNDNKYEPLNYYGYTKLKGEKAVSSQLKNYYIVRIAWVFGKNGNNFVKTMLSLANKGYKELRVVDDQIGTPTYTYDLARLLVDIIQTDKYGYYHATNEGGFISWADFAEEIFKQANKEIKINKVSTEEYGVSVAKRPFNSRLDKSKLIKKGFVPLPNWKAALSNYLTIVGEAKMEDSLISVVVPVYNCEKYIRRCVDSLVNQTYKNIQIILVNDGSKDRSGIICDLLKEQYPNTIEVIHQDNSGQANARNNGVKLAKGDFISFIDGDDWVDSSFLDTLYRNAVQSKADISCCGIQKENSKHRFHPFNTDISMLKIFKKEDALRELLNNTIITSSPCDKLYKASIIKECPMTEGIVYEDYEVMPRWISKPERIVYTGHPLYFYAFNSSSTTRFNNPRILEQITASNNRVSFYKEFFPSLYEDAFAESLFTKIGILGRSTFVKGKKKERKDLRRVILQDYKLVDKKKLTKATILKIRIIKLGILPFDFCNVLYSLVRRLVFFR